MIRFLKRNLVTTLKLPAAMAWDFISLGNMGDGASTSKVLREHQNQKYRDDLFDQIEEIKKALK